MPEIVQLVIGFQRCEQGRNCGWATDPAQGIRRSTTDLCIWVTLQHSYQGDDSPLVSEIVQASTSLPANDDLGVSEQRQHQLDRPRRVDSQDSLASGTPCFRVRSGQFRNEQRK